MQPNHKVKGMWMDGMVGSGMWHCWVKNVTFNIAIDESIPSIIIRTDKNRNKPDISSRNEYTKGLIFIK